MGLGAQPMIKVPSPLLPIHNNTHILVHNNYYGGCGKKKLALQ